MDEQALRSLLERVQRAETPISEALDTLRQLPFESVGFATIDTHRALRSGFPEVVLCQGKQPEHVVAIMERLCRGEAPVLATRAAPEVAELVCAKLPDVRYHPIGRCLIYEPRPLPKNPGHILVISAGTADLPVAEEAALTADLMGNHVERIFDVGVAGLHRLIAHLPRITQAQVVVVVAGMEGALPSVVGGLVRRPVIAVPTSIGYGASFGGLSALLGMLNSCAAGVTVVNIDNGFGAGFAAAQINRLVREAHQSEE
jgi:pyridinium-3,5-biscarboxylic acid mononucleotide synthase